MTELIEKLLILQDRDRQIRRIQEELDRIPPEQQALQARAAAVEAQLEDAKNRSKQSESARKALELEINAQKELISRYANQQFQTRKNEEYRALAHEIEMCKANIFKIEDQEIALMEQAEAAQKEIIQATQAAAETRRLADDQLAKLAAREKNLQEELARLSSDREALAVAAGETARSRYERLIRTKGENIVVGVQRGVCGGCHMRLPPQLLVTCQGEKELVTCSNCGRILYYTPDMDLAVAD